LGQKGRALAGADEVGVVLRDEGDEGAELVRCEAGGRVEVVVGRDAVVVIGVWLRCGGRALIYFHGGE